MAQIMTTKEIANYLKLHQITICKLAQKGKIPSIRIGRVWRFDKDIIDEWNRLDKAAKKQKVPTKKVIDRARPIPAMINTYQERQLGGQYGEPVRIPLPCNIQ